MEKRKPKKCKQCGKEFFPFSSLEKFCTKKCSSLVEKVKRAKKKEKKQASIPFLSKKADKLWSIAVRKVGFCQYCGTPENLNAHHIFSRTNSKTRWEFENGICLCARHHTFSNEFSAHRTPTEFTRWFESKFGIYLLDSLESMAHDPSFKATEEYITGKIAELSEIIAN